MNPTIIGHISVDNLKEILPDGSCSHVAFEGLDPNNFKGEVIRLLGVDEESIEESYADDMDIYMR